MKLSAIVFERYHARRAQVWGYLGVGFMAYLSPALLFALSAYLISKASLRPGILTLGVAIGAVRFFALARGASQYGERMLGHSLTLDVAAKVRTLLFERLALVVPYRVRPGVFGEVLASLNGDMNQLEELAARLVGPILGVGLAALTAVVVVGLVSVDFLVALLPTLVVIGVVVPLLAYRWARGQARESPQLRAQTYDDAVAAAATFESRYFLGGDDSLLGHLAAKAQRLVRPARRQAGIGAWLGLINAGVEAAALTATLLIGADLIRAHRLGNVELAVIPFLLLAILEGLTSIGLEAAKAGSGTPAIERLEGTLTLEGRDSRTLDGALPEATPVPIDFDQVSFTYPDATRPVIDVLSLHIDAGERLLVVGPTGSGKSTLAALIMGAWTPSDGVLRLGGIPSTELSEEAIAHAVAYLSSEPYVFAAPLAANLRLAQSTASDAALIDALDRVGLGPWFRGLPEGLATLVGASNRKVSQGEAQRLALARLLVLNPRNVVLDEPTAGLDGENEQMVVEILNEQFAGATIVAITHSEAFMETFRSDKILDFANEWTSKDGPMMASSVRGANKQAG
jgi:thiol reductant ABC exporter CydC subunit